MKSKLAINEISRKYGNKSALAPLSFELLEGECLTVFGPNGAGKSTLLKILSQQIKASSGSFSYEDIPVKKLGENYRKKIGVISHHSFLYEGLSGLENLKFYASLYSVENPLAKSRELLARVEMSRYMHDPVNTYSRGMLQRVSIARALVNDPEIVFLDEPYTGLDKHASQVLTGLIKEQVTKKTVVVLVTHDINLGFDLASKVMILSKGQAVHYSLKNEINDPEMLYLSTIGKAERL